jgi:hypothetical protein
MEERMGYGLPTSVEINGKDFDVRYDFRVVLDIFEALNDPELSDADKAQAVLEMFYLDPYGIDDYQKAIDLCFEFINGGERERNSGEKKPRLVDWQMDFPRIVAPINRVLGYEVRAVPYDPETNTGGVHWYTFLGAYMEIGDCLFAQIVGIRSKKAKGKKLDKSEQDFYKANRDIIDIKTKYTEAEEDILRQFITPKG